VRPGGHSLLRPRLRQRLYQGSRKRLALVEKTKGQRRADGHVVGILVRDQLEREVEIAVEALRGLSRRSPGVEQSLGPAREDLARRLLRVSALGADLRDLLEPFLLEVVLELRRVDGDRVVVAAVADELQARRRDPDGAGRVVPVAASQRCRAGAREERER